MDAPPIEIDGARVLFAAIIGEPIKPTGSTTHFVGGKRMAAVSGLAIVQNGSEGSRSLLYCDDAWRAFTDAWHACLADAMHQAEFEYGGISERWIRVSDAI